MSNCRFDGLISHSNNPSSLQNDEGATTTPEKKIRSKKGGLKKNSENLVQNLEFGTKITPNCIILTLPIRTVSEGNCTEPWQKRHKRHKLQKKIVFFEMLPVKYLISSPCRLTLIRYAPGTLNKHDNLPMSLKYIVDQVCAEITGDYRPGRADDGDEFTFQYDQVKSKVYGVKIIIEFGIE